MIERNVHHAGKTPSRTMIALSDRNTHTGLWRACFETWQGEVGNEHLMAKLSSAPLFETEEDANAAADRALDCLQTTGWFPNMCEKF